TAAELVASWFAWLFFADDQCEEGAYGSAQRWTDVTKAVRGVLEHDVAGPLADAPLIRALADLSRRFHPLVSPAWKRRFAGHVLDTMAAALREIQLREGGIPPPLSEYVALRRDSGGVIHSFDLIEVCAQVELPAEVYHSPIFQGIILAGADIVCWTNDLYSLDKEIACGNVSNIILVLQRERELNREQAFSATRTLIGDRVNDLLAAEQHLPALTRRLDPAAQEAVRRCVAGVRDWIAGSNRWHADGTTRYQQPPPGAAASPIGDLFDPAAR
ncbi:MAG: terpene synthase family protein, partial [Pseudonocardiaceae bacterium]